MENHMYRNTLALLIFSFLTVSALHAAPQQSKKAARTAKTEQSASKKQSKSAMRQARNSKRVAQVQATRDANRPAKRADQNAMAQERHDDRAAARTSGNKNRKAAKKNN